MFDGQTPELVLQAEGDEGVQFVLEATHGPVVGPFVRAAWAIDLDAIADPWLWSALRFDVPTLALVGVTPAEILLAVQARFAPEEPTVDAAYMHAAIGAEDYEAAEPLWHCALEAGQLKALYGLGYTLMEIDRPREAYDVLRRYTELTPYNAWASCWLGRACTVLGYVCEATAALERAVALEEDGGFETDAPELLSGLRET
ncbi:MAG: hypothetical protein M3P44_01545 [Actinomycetota bacterium]|nr:hypothetical protein [Actinomycetota bacterium]